MPASLFPLLPPSPSLHSEVGHSGSTVHSDAAASGERRERGTHRGKHRGEEEKQEEKSVQSSVCVCGQINIFVLASATLQKKTHT